MFKKIVAFAALAAVLQVLYGCNTVQGIGKDMQKVGEKMEEAGKKK